jgi:mannose-6-phosphate isomerase
MNNPDAKLNEPLKFSPILLEKIWGGDKLFGILNKGDGKKKNIGESWEVSDNDTAQNVINGGTFYNQSFRDIFLKYSREILGVHYDSFIKRFPLLIKFIDAHADLSVQVHPGENNLLGDAKTETWYVVHAPEDGKIIVGISSPKPREEVLEDLKTTRARSVLNSIPVKSGDVLFIPAGTVHAITSGLVIYEVQQNSDTTFRLYDWDRVDEQGNPRELHVDKAAQVIDYTVHDKHKIIPLPIDTGKCKIAFLVACPYFALTKYFEFCGVVDLDLHDHFQVLTCMKGEVKVSFNSIGYSLCLGESMLLPAVCKKVQLEEVEGEAELVASFIPRIEQEIVNPLKRAGYSEVEIQQLGGKAQLKAY